MFTRLVRCALVAAFLLVSSLAMAQVPMPVYVVPVVVKAPGANSTNWSTDLFLTNLGAQTASVSAHYFPAGQANTFNGTFAKPDMSLTAGQTLIVSDVVGSWFPAAGANTKGWLFIADTGAINCNDDQPQVAKLAVSARVFNSTGGGATFGQIVEAAWGSINLSGEPTVFTGIRNNGAAKPGSRTNIGVANLSTVPISVEIKLFRSSGALAGTATRQISALSLGQWYLQSLGFPAFSGGGRVEVRLVEPSFPNFDPCADGDSALPGCIDRCAEGCNGRYTFSNVKSFIAYASNVDNVTGDGENMLPVVDHLAFYEWMSDYVDAYCPDKGQSLLKGVARRLGLEWSTEPTFRKIVD
jgi:hypothetical protein